VGAESYLTDLFGLDGHTVLVTGGRTGIGRAVAAGAARAGADVVVTSRTPDELEPLLEELRAAGAQALGLALDVRDPDSVRLAVEATLERFGKVDVLVNNAGVALHRPALEISAGDWSDLIETNLTGPFAMAKAVATAMIEAGYGRIVNLSSTYAQIVAPGRAAYSTSKAALGHLTRALAVEWAPHGVTVNAVAPTTIVTPSRAEILSDEEFVQRRVAEIPVGRLGEPDDVVGAGLFLASRAAGFVTGHTIMVDGGLTLQ
jgi:NAD(P)-dependent dehydrogenase (short-subunit alcohol dehydrogenase family)